jgi:hypothetical protein
VSARGIEHTLLGGVEHNWGGVECEPGRQSVL